MRALALALFAMSAAIVWWAIPSDALAWLAVPPALAGVVCWIADKRNGSMLEFMRRIEGN